MAVGFIGWTVHACAQQSAAVPDRISDFAADYLSSRPHCALVIGLLRDGKRAVRGFGETNSTHPAPPDGKTLFEIASVTKVFTGLLLADLCESGTVRLDEPINDLLPPGITGPPQPDGLITLGNLATHTSGLSRGSRGIFSPPICSIPTRITPMPISSPALPRRNWRANRGLLPVTQTTASASWANCSHRKPVPRTSY